MREAKYRWVILAIMLAVAFGAGAIRERSDRAALLWPAASVAGPHEELPTGEYVTVVNETGAVISHTGHVLAAGDEFVSADNKRYQVIEVAGGKARCKLVGTVTIEEPVPAAQAAGVGGAQAPVPGRGAPANSVGIYHTHSDEAYVPTEGSESVRTGGGVIRVGTVLKDALTGKTIHAVQDPTSHAPHDAMAYARSRRTAANLVGQARAALFDVHRDAAPPGEYTKQVAGNRVTQIMLVVGRQNPKYQTNLEFAKRLKTAVDKTHPGLIKGILLARGSFNQDLHDRALLLEVGADSNSREEAERAVRLLADDLPKVVGASTLPGGGLTGTTGAQGRSAARALGGILVLLGLGVVGYLFISTGGLKEAMSKVGKFGGRELANYLGGHSRRRGGSGGSRGNRGNGEENKGGCGS
ncbi:MAG: stage II sporulation protein P [Firmicutes bacterium]|nr:stage II sporulation protein P [Bacillota bacterium]